MLTPSHGRGWYVSAKVPKEFPNTLESFSETASAPRPDALLRRAARRSRRRPRWTRPRSCRSRPARRCSTCERIRRLDQVPVAVDTSFFPVALVPDLSRIDFRNASLFGLLIDAGVDLARAETTIEAHDADPVLAAPSRHRCRQVRPWSCASSSSIPPAGRCCPRRSATPATAIACAHPSPAPARPPPLALRRHGWIANSGPGRQEPRARGHMG